ncbi:MAG: hypothetical protein HOQ32_19090 [Lysobacter sp.]|nr:hypothetical protein [Lysobacter sp.]
MKAFAIAVAVAAGLAWSAPAAAAVPTDAEVLQIQKLLGFDVAIERVIVGKIDKAEEFKAFNDTQRGCIKSELLPEFRNVMRQSFRDLFGDGDTIAAWTAFGQTKGGAKFVAGMRSQIVASIDSAVEGTAKQPEAPEFFKGMDAEELMQVMEFMQSPAGKVLERDFPDTDITPAQVEKVGQRVSERCGIEMPKV